MNQFQTKISFPLALDFSCSIYSRMITSSLRLSKPNHFYVTHVTSSTLHALHPVPLLRSAVHATRIALAPVASAAAGGASAPPAAADRGWQDVPKTSRTSSGELTFLKIT